jgi:hypothetical protein
MSEALSHTVESLVKPVKFVSITPIQDAASDNKASVKFVVEADTVTNALSDARSEEVIRRGIQEVRKQFGLTDVGLSSHGVVLPCDAEGKTFAGNTSSPAAGGTVFYATVTHTFLGSP